MKRVKILLVCAAIAAALAGCNKDIQQNAPTVQPGQSPNAVVLHAIQER